MPNAMPDLEAADEDLGGAAGCDRRMRMLIMNSETIDNLERDANGHSATESSPLQCRSVPHVPDDRRQTRSIDIRTQFKSHMRFPLVLDLHGRPPHTYPLSGLLVSGPFGPQSRWTPGTGASSGNENPPPPF